MHRVVAKFLDHRGRWVVEKGPWLAAERDAEAWAQVFRNLGYKTCLERMHGSLSGEDDALHDALSSMA